MENNRSFFVTDFHEVANELNIEFSILGEIERDNIFRTLLEKFFSKPIQEELLNIPLWHFLKEENYIGVHLPNAALDRSLVYKKFSNVSEVMFMFDLEYSSNIYKFKDLAHLFRVLSESYNFNFYIFSISFDFLISWNKDEVLFGCGKAEDWVLQIKKNWISIDPLR